MGPLSPLPLTCHSGKAASQDATAANTRSLCQDEPGQHSGRCTPARLLVASAGPVFSLGQSYPGAGSFWVTIWPGLASDLEPLGTLRSRALLCSGRRATAPDPLHACEPFSPCSTITESRRLWDWRVREKPETKTESQEFRGQHACPWG